MNSPIVLFVYNRLVHTKKTIDALKKNHLASDSDLFIFSDASKGGKDDIQVNEVRNYIRTLKGFKSIKIFEQKENLGLANSVINGVSEIVGKFGKVIVLEDDLETSPYFLSYMNSALDFYQKYESVFSISGYSYPPSLMKVPDIYNFDVYCSLRSHSWGWGIWKDRWEKISWDMEYFPSFIKNKAQVEAFNQGGEDLSHMLNAQYDGKIDSWAVRFAFYHFVNHSVAIYPRYSYVNNIGTDGSGTHFKTTVEKYNCDVSRAKKIDEDFKFLDIIYEDTHIIKGLKKVYKPLCFFKRGINKLARVFFGNNIFRK